MKAIYLAFLSATVFLLGCGQTIETPTMAERESPTQPSITMTLTPTPFPTFSAPAPESTFTEVGSTATIAGDDISGRAIVAGLQTLIIRGFVFDGKDTAADIRLIKAGAPEEPFAILLDLEQRIYDQETLVLVIPNGLADTEVDAIAVYATDSQMLLASASFE